MKAANNDRDAPARARRRVPGGKPARAAAIVGAVALAGAGAARAQQTAVVPAGNAPDVQGGVFAGSRTNLLANIWGLRPLLADVGASLGLAETSEDLGNLTGGIHHGFDYDGLTLMGLGVDTEKAFGWPGGILNVTAEQIHGRDLSTDNLDDLQTASGIEAQRSTRLWELWYQQSLAGGKLDVKVGQQSLDQEFLISSYSSLYINTVAGWPLLPSVDMYAGGPAYPLSSLGVRVRVQPTSAVTILAGVFDDNPAGGPFADDPQVRGAEQSGTEFDLGTGALSIAEVQYAINQPPADGGPTPKNAGLPGTYRFGAWYDSGVLPDQRFDALGRSLASPLSSRVPRGDRGNYSLYAVGDQMLWRPDSKAARSFGAFLRVMGAPADRNLISLGASGGANLKAPLASRPNDTAGMSFGLGQVSRAAAALDAELPGVPVRTVEFFVELTYQAQVTGWWVVQPDLQYVTRPGGGLADPTDPGHEIGNELIVGARTAVTF